MVAVAKKHGKWFLQDAEAKLRDTLVPLVPPWFQTNHLTLLTLCWIVPTVLSGYFAQKNINLLLICSVTVFGQYITDVLDGAVGRKRNTGLVNWGYYMDHFLDFCFICSLLFAHTFIIPKEYSSLFLLLIFSIVAHFIHTYLRFSITRQFKMSTAGVGPTEFRLLFICVNILSVFLYSYIQYLIYFALSVSIFFLILSVVRTQRMLWIFDMQNKKKLKK